MDLEAKRAAESEAFRQVSQPSSFKAGQRLVVSGYRERSATTIRLMELGLLPGTTFQVIRVAPLGDPVEVLLRDYSLSLRKSELRLLEVSE